MSAAFHAFDYHCVRSGSCNPFCQFYIRYYGNHFDPGFVHRFDPGYRAAGAGGDKCHLFPADNICNFFYIRSHQHQVYTKRLIRQAFRFFNFFFYPLRGTASCADNTGAACIGYGSSQCSVTAPGHASLDDRIADS